ASVGHFTVALLPLLRFLAPPDQRKRRAGHYGNVGASHDFEQTQRMRYLFVAPLVAADYRDSQYLDLRRLDHHKKGLQVAASGAGAVLIDDDLAARLGWGEAGHEQEEQDHGYRAGVRTGAALRG